MLKDSEGWGWYLSYSTGTEPSSSKCLLDKIISPVMCTYMFFLFVVPNLNNSQIASIQGDGNHWRTNWPGTFILAFLLSNVVRNKFFLFMLLNL